MIDKHILLTASGIVISRFLLPLPTPGPEPVLFTGPLFASFEASAASSLISAKASSSCFFSSSLFSVFSFCSLVC